QKAGTEDAGRRPEGHGQLFAQEDEILGPRPGSQSNEMVGQDRGEQEEDDREDPSTGTPPTLRLESSLNPAIEEKRRGDPQPDRDQGDREEVEWVGDGVRDKKDGGHPNSNDPGEEDGEGPTGGRERPCVMEGWHERKEDGAEGEESGEKVDQLDLACCHRSPPRGSCGSGQSELA